MTSTVEYVERSAERTVCKDHAVSFFEYVRLQDVLRFRANGNMASAASRLEHLR